MIEAFILSRREQISGVDARNARPLSADKRAELAPFLDANQHVIIDDRIRKLAAEIVGSEKNPVLAARRLYDWELANLDYWVKQ
jgi:transglutaminase-like putative cysteine protease